MPKTKKPDGRYEKVTEKIIKLLEKKQVPWVKPWSSTPFSNLISKHVYQGINPLLCQIDLMLHEDWDSPYFVGFGQAKELGWNVKKGSSATNLLYANTRALKGEDENGKETETFVGFAKWQNVFSIHCIDDSKSDKKIIDFIEQQTNKHNQDSKLPNLEEFCKLQKVEIKHQGEQACYSPSLDVINMPRLEEFTSAYTYYCTLLHELAHSTGHKKRLNRPMTGRFGTKDYAAEELVAELGSAFVSNYLKLDKNQEIEHHVSYLQSWLKKLKNEPKFFFTAISQARKAADYLLTEAKLIDRTTTSN